MGISLYLLGGCRLALANELKTLAVRRPVLLCTYLVAQNDWVSREELLLLFWPEDTEANARNKLRQLVHKTKKEPFAEKLELEESRLRLCLKNDLQAFKEAFEQSDWQQVLSLYKGDLLEGEQAKRLPKYQEWLELTREEYMQMWREASLNYAQMLAERSDFIDANKYLQAVLEKDLLAEEVLQLYLRYAVHAGQRQDALRLFERFKSYLRQDLQMDPLEETLELVEKLKNYTEKSELSSTAKSSEEIVAQKSQERFELPSYATAFVGRDIEIVEITNLLDSEARLISILGIGGIGKTRLVIEIARQAKHQFKDGVIYVPLAALSSAEYFVNYCLECFEVTPYPHFKPEEQMLSYAKNHEHLFIFDNFEHVIKAKDIIAKLLNASSKSKIIITSRETLKLSAEYSYELKGLSVPKTQNAIEAYDAVQLFIKTARRANSSFSLDETTALDIGKLCRLLEGSPLAIELAASWSRLLKPNEITEELERNLDFLETEMNDMPERHRSARAVFEQSWNLLNLQEQELLKKLSVFQGGFTKEAAQTVANANLRTLLSLVNKSLLNRNQQGRFLRHVLVQQYSKEKLAQDQTLELAIKQKHTDYYQSLIDENHESSSYEEQFAYIEKLEREHSNLRLALDWQLTQTDLEASFRFARNMSFFWEWQCYFDEAYSYLRQITKHSQEQNQSSGYAKILELLAAFSYFKGDLEKAHILAEQAFTIFKHQKSKTGQCDTTWLVARIYHSQGNYLEAKSQIELCLNLANALNNDYRKARALTKLAAVYERLDNHDLAYIHLEEALSLVNKLNDLKGISDCVYQMGTIHFMNADYKLALQSLEKSVSIAERINYQMRLVDAKNVLGNILREQASFKQAQSCYELSLEIAQKIGDTVGVSFALDNLGLIIRELGRPSQGKLYIQESLKLRQGFKGKWGIASCLHRIAAIEAELGKAKIAATLWGVSEKLWQELQSPKPKTYHKRFERDLDMAKRQLSQAEFEVAFRHGQEMSLENAIDLALSNEMDDKQEQFV